MNKIVNYTTGGVRCPAENCSSKICYECLARAFLEQLVNGNRFDYINVSKAQCVHCRVYTLVVSNSGSDGLVANINCERFSEFLMKHIKIDITNCQQMLGLVCMELARHRHALHALLRGISTELLTDDEVQLMINFKNFIIKYTGETGDSWSFNQALNRGFRAAKWMSKHFVLSIAIEVKQIDSLLAQKFGF